MQKSIGLGLLLMSVLIARDALASPQTDRAALLEALSRELAPDAQPAWTSTDAERAATWLAHPPTATQTIDAFLGRANEPSHDPDSAPAPLSCALSQRAPKLAARINTLVQKSAACFAPTNKSATCRENLAAEWTALHAAVRVDDFTASSEIWRRERELSLSLADAHGEAAFVANHEMDLCIAKIPAWPAGLAGPIDLIERCKAQSSVTRDAQPKVTIASETARLERIIRTRHVVECKSTLPEADGTQRCHQRYAEPASLALLKAELSYEADVLRRSFVLPTAPVMSLVTQLAHQLLRSNCWRTQSTPQDAPIDCEAAPDSARVPPLPKMIMQLYNRAAQRSWWTDMLGLRGTARDALRLSCVEQTRADAYAAALKKHHLDWATCLTKASTQTTTEALFTVAAECRAHAVAARAALNDNPRFALPNVSAKGN